MHTARELKVPLAGTAIVHELFSALLAREEGDLDDSAIITIIEGLAGIQARSNKMGKG